MEDSVIRTKTSALYVGVGVGSYQHASFQPLKKVLEEAKDIGTELSRFGYQTIGIPNPNSDVVRARLKAEVSSGTIQNSGSIVIYWSGHGLPTAEKELWLITEESIPNQVPEITAKYIAGVAARSGASQILLIFDTCYSNAGVLDAVQAASRIRNEVMSTGNPTWIGVIASALDYQRAQDGVFGQQLLRLLRDGPNDPELRLRWSAHNAGVRGDDLIDALVKEWPRDISEQKPNRSTDGDPWVMLPNPRFDPDAVERVVEHLLLAARGVAPGEEGSYFTGRTRPIEQIVAWMQTNDTGIFVLTGPAGSGKSAIAGRIVSLSNRTERQKILANTDVEHADPDEGSVHAHANVRGMTVQRLAQVLDEQLSNARYISKNTMGARNLYELIGEIQRSGKTFVLVIDGLDEARLEAWTLADQGIKLLAKFCKVLVSTRELPRQNEDGLSLIQVLEPQQTIKLGEEALKEDTRRDVERYVKKRLANAPAIMDPAKISAAVWRLARSETEGPFLLARVVTSQLRDQPVDTSEAGWEQQLDRSLESAFSRDVARLPPLCRDKTVRPQAASELLTALAWCYGTGWPADLWAIAATALSDTRATYHREDVFWILQEAGRYIIEAGESGQAVYRLSHQKLVDNLRPERAVFSVGDDQRQQAVRLANALVDHYRASLAGGRTAREIPYLWNYLWQHCVDAEEEGIAALRALVSIDSESFLLDLASALNNLGIRYSGVGKWQEALAPTEEAAGIYRILAKTNPAFLPNLAWALNNLGIRYREVGKWQEALAPTEEAAGIYRILAKTNPAFLPNLAWALNNLGIRYSEVGKRQKAVAPIEEAVGIRRTLAKSNPAVLPDLARALYNLGICYSQAGKPQEAVAPTKKAVRIYRTVTKTSSASLPDLASALNNLGSRYSEVGKRKEALAPVEEAVSTYRTVTNTDPTFLPDLATALNNLSVCYSNAGKRDEAVAPAEEAVGIFRTLPKINPTFLPNLASALNNLGIHYSEVRKRQEAVARTEEAVGIYRTLAKTNPAFLPDLALTLNNLGSRYSEVGRDDLLESCWNDAIDFIDSNAGKAFLLLRRAEQLDIDVTLAVSKLIKAQALIGDANEELQTDLQSVCRQRRQHDGAAFDAAWRARSNAGPPINGD